MLEIINLSVNYGNIQALKNINLEVKQGEIVTLIGANGAGKSTILNTISRLLKPSQGKLIYQNQDLSKYSPDRVVKMGIAQSPEGRRILAKQTVLTNLELGAYTRKDSISIKEDLEKQFTLFPRLAERKSQIAGTLSGGEQQMLAIARALMSRPRLLLLDEPSLGLAPQIVQEIFKIIVQLNQSGITILLVEQNAHLALQTSHKAYVLEAGIIVLHGEASSLLNDEKVKEAYLGIG
jgi:branched-chain amino acid transport system ATP-binding protein